MNTHKFKIQLLTLILGLTTSLWLKGQDVVMSDATITRCDVLFSDSGDNGGNYGDNENYILTVTPEQADELVRVSFSSFQLETGFDMLLIYDGPDTNAPLIADLTGPDLPADYTALNNNGVLTFHFISDGSSTFSGWEATLNCVPRTPPLDNLCNSTLNFDGTNDYVALADMSDELHPQDLTIESWIKTSASKDQAILAVNTSIGGNVVLLRVDNGNAKVYDGADSAFEIEDTETLNDDSWHHIAYTKEGTTGTLYVNGRNAGTHTTNFTFTAGDLWSLGQEFDGTNNSDYFHGTMDETRVWSVALSQNQVQYNAFRKIQGNETSLVAAYDFNEGAGSESLYDLTDNRHHGSLINMIENECWIDLEGNTTSCLLRQKITFDQIPEKISGDDPFMLSYTENSGNPIVFTSSDPSVIFLDGQNAYVHGPGEAVITISQEETQTHKAGFAAQTVVVQHREIVMHNSTGPPTWACGSIFTDTGGSIGDYSPNENLTLRMVPEFQNYLLIVSFSSFDLNNDDVLYVYDGYSQDDPLIASFTGGNLPDDIVSTNGDGALTFVFESDEHFDGEGWEALITCVEAVPAKPEPVIFSNHSLASVMVSWEEPKSYERTIIDYSLQQKTADGEYTTIYTGNSLSYEVTGLAVAESYSFRINARNDVGSSDFSDGVALPTNRYFMSDNTFPICSGTFMDSGGEVGDYSDNENSTITFLSETAGNFVNVSFTSFDLQAGDLLTVYDGSDEFAQELISLTGSDLPSGITASNEQGALTFVFESDGSSTSTGWEAMISCVSAVPMQPNPVSFSNQSLSSVTINWEEPHDNGQAIISYNLWQNDDFGGGIVYSGSDLSYEATGLVDGVTYGFRVNAVNAEGTSVYSEQVYIIGGYFFMSDNTITTCGGFFIDSSTFDNYGENEDYTITFLPEGGNGFVRMSFSNFNVGDDALKVYDGIDISAPLLNTLTGDDLPSNITASNPSGALTFRFESNASISGYGWWAELSCDKLSSETTFPPVFDDCNTVLEFDGVNDYVALPQIVQSIPHGEFTMEAWAKVNDIGQNSIISVNTESGENVVLLRAGDNEVKLYDGSDGVFEIEGGEVSVDSWFHVAYTKTGSNGTLYLNGQQIGTHTVDYQLSNDDQWTIGQEFDGDTPSDFINGSIGEVRIWDRALTQTELESSFNFPVDRLSTGLVAYYDFNEAPGSTILRDLSYHGHHGTLINMSTAYTWIDLDGNVSTCLPRQTIALDAIPNQLLGGADFDLSYSEESGNSVIFTSSDESVISIDGSIAHVEGLGETLITISQAADDNYRSGSSSQIVTVETDLIMSSGTITVCGVPFFDSGRQSSDYSSGEDYTLTVVPESLNHQVSISFTSFDVEEDYDYLHVYDGSDTNAPLLAELTGTSIPADLTATSASGELTFHFASDNSEVHSGWEATIGCEEATSWDGNNWSNGVPNDQLYAIVAGDYTGAGFTCSRLVVTSFGSLYITSGTLDVKGDVTNNSMIELYSGASLLTYNGANWSGNAASIYRNTRYEDGRYSFVGTPVIQGSSVTASGLGSHVFTYNETIAFGTTGATRWIPTNDEELLPGKGYTQANQQEVYFSGEPNTGTITYAGTYTEDALDANEGWNLISNPYAAAISVADFLTANSHTSGSVYLWDDNGSDTQRGSNADYIVANGSMASSTAAGGQSRYNFHLGSAQGFFMKLSDDSNTDITFTETMRRSGSNEDDDFFRTTELPIIRVNLTDDQGLFKQMVIGLAEEATEQTLNPTYDGQAFNSLSDFGIFSMKAGRSLVLNGLKHDWTSVQLQLNVKEAGQYQISTELESYDASVYLMDHLLGEVVDLRDGPYLFTTKGGIVTDRFELMSAPSSVLGIGRSEVLVYGLEKSLFIHKEDESPHEFYLYNMNGKLLYTTSVQARKTEISLHGLAAGIYLVFDGEKTHKIILD